MYYANHMKQKVLHLSCLEKDYFFFFWFWFCSAVVAPITFPSRLFLFAYIFFILHSSPHTRMYTQPLPTRRTQHYVNFK